MRAIRVAFAVAVLVGGAAGSARADDVTQQIDEALAAYQHKDTTTAIAALNAAISLLRQGQGDVWKTLLPPPPPGWTAQDAEAAGGAAALVLGTGVSRTYTNGGQGVDVSLLSDSPPVQALAAALGNSIIADLAGTTLVIDGRRVLYRKEDNSFTTLVAGKVLLRISGTPDVPQATLRAFLAAVPFAAIEQAAR